MPRLDGFSRPRRFHQRTFAFYERHLRRQRWFRGAIILATVAVCAALLSLTTAGRYLLARTSLAAQAAAYRALGYPDDPEARQADRRVRRESGVAMTQRLLERVYREATPEIQRFLVGAGMSPDDRVLRWGNFDGVLLLSSRVFEPDDAGRSYRLRSGVRSVWLRNIELPRGMSGFFLVPDDLEVLRLAKACGAYELPESLQTTNSWGCRGPEPNLDADLRVLVLGDSFMQGLFLGDSETPPACLQRELEERTGGSVSVLNTGNLGYSPEQYHATLMEYVDRFRPHVVVLSICANDFGGEDWTESGDWLARIWQFCRSRETPCLTVPVPESLQVTSSRSAARFQGRLAAMARVVSAEYLNPIEDFVDRQMALINEARRKGERVQSSPLYNAHLNDGHFSPEGARVWARAVARRLVLIRERMHRQRMPVATGPSP